MTSTNSLSPKQTKGLRTGIAISLLLFLGGCAGGGVCTGWQPINPSRKDVLTEGTAKQILKLDEYGKALGCPAFRPKRKW